MNKMSVGVGKKCIYIGEKIGIIIGKKRIRY